MSWAAEKCRLAKHIIEELYKRSMIKTWYKHTPQGWSLVSGLWSPFYIQLRALPSHPELLKLVGGALAKLIKNDCGAVNRLVGIAMAGIPIATAISIAGDIPCSYTRKLEGVHTIEACTESLRHYGEHSMIEGELKDGDRVALVDDLVTRFDSKAIALKLLEHEVKLRKLQDVRVEAVVVLLDREQGAAAAAAEYGVDLYSLIQFKSVGLKWLRDEGLLCELEYEVISDYLENPAKYQASKVQKRLASLAIPQAT